MTAIIWTAKRRLATGSSVGDQNSLDVTAAPQLSPQLHRAGVNHVSLNRNAAFFLHALYERWTVTVTVQNSDAELFDEFVASVGAGEEFTFDAFGTVASPDNAIAVKLVGGNLPAAVRNWPQQTADFNHTMVLEAQSLIT